MNMDFNSLAEMLGNKETQDTLNSILKDEKVSQLLGNLGQGNLDAQSIQSMVSNANPETISSMLAGFKEEDIQNIVSNLGGNGSDVADGLKNIISGFADSNK